ncbi:hypothetical protein EVAR_103996_1 [Eumeta japonica]|uniref:Uncharacterized protein n=1 Tax=Eumeta variegata TaxID=151549 RepID=A0A4C1XWV6_EUMVA|nr:hypothetical protein EVAR_103996_1 [Eumeta japonica]
MSITCARNTDSLPYRNDRRGSRSLIGPPPPPRHSSICSSYAHHTNEVIRDAWCTGRGPPPAVIRLGHYCGPGEPSLAVGLAPPGSRCAHIPDCFSLIKGYGVTRPSLRAIQSRTCPRPKRHLSVGCVPTAGRAPRGARGPRLFIFHEAEFSARRLRGSRSRIFREVAEEQSTFPGTQSIM